MLRLKKLIQLRHYIYKYHGHLFSFVGNRGIQSQKINTAIIIIESFTTISYQHLYQIKNDKHKYINLKNVVKKNSCISPCKSHYINIYFQIHFLLYHQKKKSMQTHNNK